MFYYYQSLRLMSSFGDMPGYCLYPGPVDQRDIVWPKLQVLKAKYLQDMEQLYGLICRFDSRVLNAEHKQKLNHYKEVIRRMLPYLRVTRDTLPVEFKQDLLESFAQDIVMVIEIFKRKPGSISVTTPSSASIPAREFGTVAAN